MRLSITLTCAVTLPHPPSHGAPLTKPRCTLGGAFSLRPIWSEARGTTATIVDRNHCGADTTPGHSSSPPVQIPETNRDRMDCQPNGRVALNRDRVPGEAKERVPRPFTK